MASMELNLEAVSMAASYSVLDSGMYNVGITGAEIVATKSGGNSLNLVMTVNGGANEGKSIINRMNIVNANPKTVQWALKDLKTIMAVGGHSNPNFLKDSDELLGLNFNISVEKKGQIRDGQPVLSDKGEQFMENKFLGFFKSAEVVTPVSAPPQVVAVSAPAPAKASGEFPWS